jgi:hypothetical protein
MLNGLDPSMRLALSGTTLRIEQGGSPLVLVDTRTFAARSPAATKPPIVRHIPTAGGPHTSLLWALGLGFPVTLLALLLLKRRR